MLVPIPTNEFINGYSATLGARQTIDSRALPNLLAFARVFYAALGIRLDVTEASRPRPRQKLLWDLWQAYLRRGKRPPWAALAAVPYTSRHDAVTRGNAVDLGSGIQTFATPAHQWAVINGPRYGVRPTGLEFSSPEPWHFDIDTITTAGSTATLIVPEAEKPKPKPFYRRKRNMDITFKLVDGRGKFGVVNATLTFIGALGLGWVETTGMPSANPISVYIGGYGPEGGNISPINLTYAELVKYAEACHASDTDLARYRAAAQ